MNSHDKKYIAFVSIVIIVIIATGFAFIYINQPADIPAIETITAYGTEAASVTSFNEETGSNSTEITQSDVAVFPLDINTASKTDLMQLDGIGDVIAQRVIDYRLQGDYFYTTEEIMNIKGIGNSIYNKIKDKIYVNTQNIPIQTTQQVPVTSTVTAVPSVTQQTERSEAAKTSKAAISTAAKITTSEIQVQFPIDINSADVDELMCIDGIGETIANRIIAYREVNGGFYTIEEIMEVKGIGEATFEKIKSQIYADTSGLPTKQETSSEETSTTISTTITISAVNINTATAEEFETLPKITPQLAQSIIQFRNVTLGGKFSSTYEILYVDGMTKGIFNSISDYLTL